MGGAELPALKGTSLTGFADSSLVVVGGQPKDDSPDIKPFIASCIDLGELQLILSGCAILGVLQDP